MELSYIKMKGKACIHVSGLLGLMISIVNKSAPDMYFEILWDTFYRVRTHGMTCHTLRKCYAQIFESGETGDFFLHEKNNKDSILKVLNYVHPHSEPMKISSFVSSSSAESQPTFEEFVSCCFPTMNVVDAISRALDPESLSLVSLSKISPTHLEKISCQTSSELSVLMDLILVGNVEESICSKARSIIVSIEEDAVNSMHNSFLGD